MAELTRARPRREKSADSVCPRCSGSGLVVTVREDGERFASQCECRIARRAIARLAQARIPKRYANCTLEEFSTVFGGADPSLSKAKCTAKGLIENFHPGRTGKGLLLTGDIGAGKTHLAVGILRELVENKGARGLFVDYRELLKEIQHSYNPQVATTELDILRPVFEAEVLVLDELGAVKPTDWVWDTVAHILNTRYNHELMTIITTNYANEPDSRTQGNLNPASSEAAVQANRSQTLGDRIGERMRSRLQEMCAVVKMSGGDFRQKVRSASF